MSERWSGSQNGVPAPTSSADGATEQPWPQPRFQAPVDDAFQMAGPGHTTAGAGLGKVNANPGPFGPAKGPPSGPPARVGSAVAALVCAVLTLIVPGLFWLLGVPILSLLVNVPGLVFGVIALTKTDNPPEVERFLRYSWASTLVYIALMVVIIGGILLLISMSFG